MNKSGLTKVRLGAWKHRRWSIILPVSMTVIRICHLQMGEMLLFLLRCMVTLRGVWSLIPNEYNYECLTQKQPQ